MGKKILIIEAEKDLAKTITFRLEAKGYTVIDSYDGQDGLEKAKKDKPDLVILDLMLPKMDGYKVCGLLKKDSRYARIPIIMFTARAQEEDFSLGKELGAEAFITKPFEPSELLSKIKKFLKEE